MRPGGVEVTTKALDAELRIEEREEPVLIEAFIAELPVEALDMRVLHRLAGLDELQRDAAVGGPGVERATAELAAIVEGQPRGLAAPAITVSSAVMTAVLGKL